MAANSSRVRAGSVQMLKLLFLYPNRIGPYHQDRILALSRLPEIQVRIVEVERIREVGPNWAIHKDQFAFDYEYLPRRGGLFRGYQIVRRFGPDAVIMHGYDDPLTVTLSLMCRLIGYPVLVQGESHYRSYHGDSRSRARRAQSDRALTSPRYCGVGGAGGGGGAGAVGGLVAPRSTSRTCSPAKPKLSRYANAVAISVSGPVTKMPTKQAIIPAI